MEILNDRKLDVTDKLKYIKKLNKNHEVHLHLMVNNPHKSLRYKRTDFISHYAKFADYIGVYRRTFKINYLNYYKK